MGNRKSEKGNRIIEEMKKERGGNVPAVWEYLAENDVDFLESYNNLCNKALTTGKSIAPKVKEFIAIGVLAYRGLDNAVYDHCKRALKYGATKEELLEVVETAIIPGGAPTLGSGLRALKQIEDEEKGNK